MIEMEIVSGGPELDVSKTLSYGKYVIDKLRRHCANGNQIAMVNASTDEKVSYDQLLRKIINIANGLKRMQLGKGDIIALCSENRFEFIAVAVAAICVGAAVTTLGVKYTKDEVIHALSITKPTIAFCSESAIELNLQILRGISRIKHIVQLNGSVTAPDVLSLDAIAVDQGNVEDYEPQPVNGTEDIAFVIYSSTGTTGVPKGVMLTHFNVVYGSEIFNYANQDQSNVLTIPPWYHLYALLMTTQFVVDGNLVVYMSKFKPKEYLEAIEKYQVTKLIAVSQILNLLAKSHLVDKSYDLSSVKGVWCATSAVFDIESVIAAKKNLPNCKGIFKGHGLTETTVAVLKEPEIYDENLLKEGSCGAPLPGISAKVVDINTGDKLEANHVGEICLNGPTMVKRFFDDQEAAEQIYDEEGYLKTGDVGYYDTNGCFYMIDRLRDVIIYQGQQVSPALVESVILQHTDVAECGVVGARDEAAGELPTALVVKKLGSTLTEQQLLDFTAPRLSSCSQLRGGIIFVKEIPKMNTGKIFRPELKNQLRDD